jgi:hypothetical protein
VQDRDPEIHIDQADAKGGRNRGMNMRALVIGTVLAAAALTLIWVTGALTQGPAESSGTATGRIQAEADEGLNPDNDIGMISPGVPEDPDRAEEPPLTRQQ